MSAITDALLWLPAEKLVRTHSYKSPDQFVVEYEGAVRLPFCLGAAVRVLKPREVVMDEIMKEEYMGNSGEECCLFYFGSMG